MKVSISDFLGAFYPDPNEAVWLIGFPAKKLPDDHPDKRLALKKQVTRATLANNKLIQSNLKASNEKLGMYFVVNAGGTEVKDIKRINAVFCEFDDIPIEEQHGIYDGLELKPSIRTETLKSVHAYWLIDGEMTVEQWENVQCGIMSQFRTDGKLKNRNRVMRLPHFNHVSWDDGYRYKQVTIHTFTPEVRYTASQLTEAFPYTPPPKPKYVEKGFIEDTWEGVKNELRYRISLLPSYKVERGTGWATAKGICHDGKNNTAIAVNLRTGAVVCQAGCDFYKILGTFGLSKPEMKHNKGIVKVPAREQTSELYEYLADRYR